MQWLEYLPLIAKGALSTVELALIALVLALSLGLISALAKLSGKPWLSFPAQCYTTLIRGVPDLALMLLLFYTIQIGINQVTDKLALGRFDIDPFAAGVITLGFIYGAYFAETFRGAFLAIDKGQAEAASAYGLSSRQTFQKVLLPQLIRFALPGISNNWQVLVKATALVSIIGLSDLVMAAQEAGRSTHHTLMFMMIAGGVYFCLSGFSSLLLYWVKNRSAGWVREAEL
ncbi:ABC transporter permease [Pseudomonas brassicacearum]|uniref:ABC transporter permease n=1 Tax=Pseudomonas brassicacearum TaxID=930166 RepID=UPI00087B118F|nr:ABC transporter permease subunit [Pseudomonas brassicacearum]KAB0528448.1 ABC transporter permease subunit [Pseudomonas brassicacearum subsp. brassicacearum]NJP59340.1 ABC transporter permease subunit [Pseudomonas brassicacearum]SDP24059.1 histidine transport system permease protein [Pseudomonas brassicacearum]